MGLLKKLNIETKITVAFFIPIVCLLFFFAIESSIHKQYVKEIDSNILYSLRQEGNPNRAIGPDWLADSMTELSALGSGTVIMLVVILVAGYLTAKKENFALFFILIAIIGGAIIELSLKGFYQRERPPMILHLVNAHSMSFPSGHSMMSVVVYLTLGLMLASLEEFKKVKAYIITVAILLALSIGFTRVFLGVHYPTDVLGGWSLGLFWALLCRGGYKKALDVRKTFNK